MAKRNWDLINKQQPKDTMRYRDVYEDQQLERGHLQAKQTKTSRIIICIVVTVIVAVLSYAIACVVAPGINSLMGQATNTTTNTSTSADTGDAQVSGKDSGPAMYEVEKVSLNSYKVVHKETGEVLDTWTMETVDMKNVYRCDSHPSVSIVEDSGDYKLTISSAYDMHTGEFIYSTSGNDDTSGSDSTSVTDKLTITSDKFGEYSVVNSETNEVVDVWNVSTEGMTNYYVCDNHPTVKIEEQSGDVKGTILSYYNLKTGEFSETPITSETDDSSDDGSSAKGFSVLGISFKPTMGKILFSLICSSITYLLIYTAMMRNLEAQNMLSDTADINQYQNDQHIALPEEVQRKFDWFPDVGATSDVQFSSMISHMALSNKGLKKVHLSRRAETDILDEDGDIEYYKGEVLLDDDGNPLYDEVPIIDTEFMEDLFQASGTPKDKTIRKYYDTTKIPYNPDGSDREKLGKFATVADLINADWEFPYYEPQRPAGAYIVDTAPVNTMV